MTGKPSQKSPFADVAPALADYTDNVLFGDAWKRPGLSPRDRSLITVACLISLYGRMNCRSISNWRWRCITKSARLSLKIS